MSRNSQNNRPSHGAHNRSPRNSPNTHSARSRDEQALASLPYRKGHLTPQELALFRTLRGGLDTADRAELRRVEQTLRRPFKRLRAFDLMRYWTMPLTKDQRRMLPWFAGSTWHRPLPKERLAPVALARHLLCPDAFPPFLMEPFAHPGRYHATLHWDLCRILTTVSEGRGLQGLREIDPFWTGVPAEVFDRFVETPKEIPVIEGLINAFVERWNGPTWLAKQAFSWTTLGTIQLDLPKVLRVVHGLCRDPQPQDQTRAEALRRLDRVPQYSWIFGESRTLPIPNAMPAELEGWRCHELRTPDDFEAEEQATHRYVACSFTRAKHGEVSLWSLRQQGHASITLEIEVSSMRVWRVQSRAAMGDPRDQTVMELWALANGLSV